MLQPERLGSVADLTGCPESRRYAKLAVGRSIGVWQTYAAHELSPAERPGALATLHQCLAKSVDPVPRNITGLIPWGEPVHHGTLVPMDAGNPGLAGSDDHERHVSF